MTNEGQLIPEIRFFYWKMEMVFLRPQHLATIDIYR